MRAFRLAGAAVGCLLLSTPTGALAWGRTGHAVVAEIARGYLTPKAAAAVDALLAADTDALTPADLSARASWADAYRRDHKETTEWHFVDTELGHPDLAAACYGFPAAAALASQGPAQDCVVNKINQFSAELANPATSSDERLLAFKFLIHFVGDLHQPLHAADHEDRGGNCVPLALGGPRTVNLHSYWDTVAVEAIDADPMRLATTLKAAITPALKSEWERGDATAWAMEAFEVARAKVYTLGSKPGCASDATPVVLPDGYEAQAKEVVALQMERAGVRLALLLNSAFK